MKHATNSNVVDWLLADAAASSSPITSASGLRLLPGWPSRRVLELAPVNWQKTLQQQDTQERLAANIYRRATLGEISEHQATG